MFSVMLHLYARRIRQIIPGYAYPVSRKLCTSSRVKCGRFNSCWNELWCFCGCIWKWESRGKKERKVTSRVKSTSAEKLARQICWLVLSLLAEREQRAVICSCEKDDHRDRAPFIRRFRQSLFQSLAVNKHLASRGTTGTVELRYRHAGD